jgi:cyanophycinase
MAVRPFALIPTPRGRRAASFSGMIAVCIAVAFASVPGARAAEPASSGESSGALIIIGGRTLPAFRDRFLELAGGKKARIVVIPTANAKADQGTMLATYLFFKSQDVKSVEIVHTRDRAKAGDHDFIKPLTEATGVWLMGGDQSRLTGVYHGTAVEKELKKVLARGGVVAGTSAGAAVMSALMITGGTDSASVGDGFGLISGVVVDQHFWNRRRLNRLLGVLAKHPECPGIGIDEETALVVQGQTATVMGNGNVRACLCEHGTLPASIQVLKDGEKLDLAALTRAAQARIKRRRLYPSPQ